MLKAIGFSLFYSCSVLWIPLIASLSNHHVGNMRKMESSNVNRVELLISPFMDNAFVISLRNIYLSQSSRIYYLKLNFLTLTLLSFGSGESTKISCLKGSVTSLRHYGEVVRPSGRKLCYWGCAFVGVLGPPPYLSLSLLLGCPRWELGSTCAPHHQVLPHHSPKPWHQVTIVWNLWNCEPK